LTTVLTNGMTTNLLGLHVEAVPAYNANHPRGNGNGYVVTIGGPSAFTCRAIPAAHRKCGHYRISMWPSSA
jgi:hypothetical protein